MENDVNNFTFENKTTVFFGKGSVAESLPALLGGYGKNVLLAYAVAPSRATASTTRSRASSRPPART